MFTCTATAEDGSRWQFDVEITGKKSLRVIIPPTLVVGGTHGLDDPRRLVAGQHRVGTDHDGGRDGDHSTTTDRRRQPPGQRRPADFVSAGRPIVSRPADANEVLRGYSSVVDSKEYGSPMSV